MYMEISDTKRVRHLSSGRAHAHTHKEDKKQTTEKDTVPGVIALFSAKQRAWGLRECLYTNLLCLAQKIGSPETQCLVIQKSTKFRKTLQ